MPISSEPRSPAPEDGRCWREVAILTEAFFIDSVASAGTLDRWNDVAVKALAQGLETFLVATR